MELLKVNGLTKKYMTKTVLDNIDLSLEEGKIYGLLGPNGSGKTTLLKVIAGLTQPTAGHLTVNGHKIGTATKKVVCYLPTINHLPGWMTVGRCLEFYNDFYDDFSRERAAERLEIMGLKSNQKVTALSTGMLGRLKIALAISRQARLYLLDEPLNGLDPISRDKVLQMILEAAQKDNTIVLATHIIKEIENILDEVIFLNDGQIVLAGEVDEMRLARKKSVEEVYKEVFGNV
jgi:ABC-2 type transport system ATP-binding protein